MHREYVTGFHKRKLQRKKEAQRCGELVGVNSTVSMPCLLSIFLSTFCMLAGNLKRKQRSLAWKNAHR